MKIHEKILFKIESFFDFLHITKSIYMCNSGGIETDFDILDVIFLVCQNMPKPEVLHKYAENVAILATVGKSSDEIKSYKKKLNSIKKLQRIIQVLPSNFSSFKKSPRQLSSVFCPCNGKSNS